MGKLADAFVNFLGRVHEANKTTKGGDQHKAEEAVSEAAKSLMKLYVSYEAADPEDVYDASAVKLISNVENMETFATYVMTKA
jgi:hypothetical protein